jgi:hypothetical protein
MATRPAVSIVYLESLRMATANPHQPIYSQTMRYVLLRPPLHPSVADPHIYSLRWNA